MKLNYTVTAFAVSIMMLGCQKEDQTAAEDPSDLRQKMAETSEQMQGKADEAVESAKDLAAQGRQEFMAAADRTLQEIDAAMREFDEKAATLSADAKSGAEEAMAKLKEQRQVVADQLAKAKDASAEAWQEKIRPGLETAVQELKSAYEKVKASWPPKN